MKLNVRKGAVIVCELTFAKQHVFIGKVKEVSSDEVVLLEQQKVGSRETESTREVHINPELIAWWKYANIDDIEDKMDPFVPFRKSEGKLEMDYTQYDEKGFCYGENVKRLPNDVIK